MQATRILVLGANGQIGTVLVRELRDRFGLANVVASDLLPVGAHQTGMFQVVDATDKAAISDAVAEHRISQIYHLPAILSASGEGDPLRTWHVNVAALLNTLEVAREKNIERVFFPSSIAVFGRNVVRQMTPQSASLVPETAYGMSKVAGENWCAYYHRRYGLDVRSLRYPGVISHQTAPGGGTTDYAVEIFHRAVKGEPFTCFLEPDTRLPMIYIDDVIRATVELMIAPGKSVSLRTGYNLAAVSFTPAEIAAEIKKHIPQFAIRYEPDYRQAIASGWPESIDDGAARKDWGWRHQFDLARITEDMLKQLSKEPLIKSFGSRVSDEMS